jgi:hypothetical protein
MDMGGEVAGRNGTLQVIFTRRFASQMGDAFQAVVKT